MTMRRSRLALSASSRSRKKSKSDVARLTERRLLLESLEDRRLLAVGPRLTGVQPNNSDIFSFVDQASNVRDVAPKELTLRFDENQQIDPLSLSAIRISRGGADGIPGNDPQDFIVPGFIGVGDAPRQNEIVVRFSESLPDDVFQIEILGAGTATPLRNVGGQAFIPTLNDGDGDATKDTIRFELDLGAQVVAVVPQPISRNASGSLVQARNQIQVFFNDDDLLVRSNALGQPLPDSAENPEFYQLIFTSDTVRNTDDVVILPTKVTYDPATNMATLTFAQDLDKLLHPDTQALVGPGTFRLRIGTDEAAPLPPLTVSPIQEISSDFNTGDQVVVQFTAVRPGEQGLSVFVSRRDQGGPGAPLVHVVGKAVSIDLNSNPNNESTARDVVLAVNQHPEARKLMVASINSGNPLTKVGDRTVNYSPLVLQGLGSSFETAMNLTDNTSTGPILTILGGGVAFVDSEFFEITDSNNIKRKFEFDSNVPAIKNDPAAISIPFDVNRSQAQMAQAIANAINTASFGVRAILNGNQIQFTGDTLIDLSSGVQGLTKHYHNRYDLGQVLELSAGGTVFVEGQTFELVDQNGSTRTFEFDSGYILDVTPPRGMLVPANIADGNQFSVTDGTRTVNFEFDSNLSVTTGRVAVRFTPGDSPDELGEAVADAIRQAILRGDLQGLNAFHLGGGIVEVRGQSPAIDVIVSGPLVRLAFNISNLDGQTFTIGEGASTTTFEYDSDNTFTAPNIPIDFSALTDTYLTIAAKTVAAINAEVDAGNLDTVRALNLGDGRIHLGGDLTTSLDTSLATNLAQTGLPGATGANIPVRLVPHGSFTANDVAASIANAINQASAIPGFTATALAAGNRIRLSNDKFVRVPQELAGLTVTAQGHFDAGPVLTVTKTGSGFADGQTIRIRDDQGVILAFEFDNDGSRRDPNAIAIPFNSGMSIATIAERVTEAINSAGFNVEATVVNDRIYLTNDRSVTLDANLTGLTKTSQGIIISSSIDPRPFALDLIGGSDDPGHREIPNEIGGGVEQHINPAFEANGRDATPGVTTIFYNFRSDYGTDAQGVPLSNAITAEQKERAREAFKLWARYLGVQFIESEREGLTIATGDINALNRNFPNVLDFQNNNFRVRVDPRFADSLLVMDNRVQWNDDFGETWFLNAMVGVGSMLGLGLANDLPLSTLMARFTAASPYLNDPEPEPIFPGNADVLHGQHLYRPDGVDVDLYRFTIDLDEGRTGVFTAEAFAERLPNSSLLDTVIEVFRENPDGSRELIARNDDYYSRDSFVELNLGPGVYYIGVSASSNNEYDPTLADTGFGGRSQGAYDLRLNFRSQVEEENTIRDADGDATPLDGDADGVPGGVYNFWFQTRPLDRVIQLTGNGATFRDGQVISVTNSQGVIRRFEFDNNNSIAGGNIRLAFTPTTTPEQMAQAIAAAIAGAGFGVSAVPSGSRLTFTGERAISLSTNFVGIEIQGKTIFVDKTADPNADGSLSKPFNNIARAGIPNAFSATHPGDIVRIVGNGGADGNIDTLSDNLAYEIGFGTLPGQILSDGTEMAVPQGVTVMVDPGSIFKMRRSRVGVGSSSLTVDRSGGALQVLGTPNRQVYFTSWLDETIGRDTHSPTTQPARGDWGGIIFRTDLDDAESRPNLENEGIFLNYVNHADIRYGGGGNVVIDGIQQVVQPIQMVRTRPTVTFNRITESADSAMSASPNSFDETNFHAPRYQSAGVFTSDYDRIGPDIHFNYIVNNSTNGLFIRIETPAGNVLEPLTVSGRFDDTDIVHVLAENLIIQGSQSEPFLDLERPAVDLVTFTPRTGGTLVPGTYNYKITFVDENGFEGRPSKATANFTLSGTNNAIQLNQLTPVTSGFVRRRIYRTDDPAGRVYRLVAEINASDTVFVDDGTTLNTILQRDPPPSEGITLTPQTRGSLEKGDYSYRIVFVDALGREGASSDATSVITLDGAPTQGGVRLDNLPAATGEFVARRIYRSTIGGISPYRLVAEIDATSTSYIDDGFTIGDLLDPSAYGVIRARPHARLAIDPGTVVKMEGARIEAKFGGQLIAEGKVGQEVIFTSRLDDHFGAGGTFDTNDDADQVVNSAVPAPGNWGGLYFGPLSRASIDHAYIAYGGGVSRIEGTFTGFNVIEAHQAELRLTHSIIENNAEGVGGQGPLDRFGRGYNRVGTIFVRGSQPIIVDNIFRDNNVAYKPTNDPNRTSPAYQMPVITINANSFTSDLVRDYGRSTGLVDSVATYNDNRGPLVRDNRMSNNAINGMVIRGEVLTTQSVWDDTDIVHVLTNQFDQQDSRNGFRLWAFDEIVIPEHHSLGGLRLQSSPTESLVIKLLGAGHLNNSVNMSDDGSISNRNAYNGAGFTVLGRRFEIEDRIGGSLHVVGQPGFPVVMTSLHDDSVGAGVQPDDRPQTDTNNNGIASVPRPNDWRSIKLDQFSNDRNVEIVMEMESSDITAPGINASTNTAQVIGRLASSEQTGDDNLRMGFEIHGFLNEPNDIDVYAFTANAGTEIWVDIDRTTFSLDTVIELLDSSGNVLARSNDTLNEQNGVEFISGLIQPNLVHPLQKSPTPYYPTHASGLPKDYFSTNPRDAGMRIALPGNAGTPSTYHLLVRSEKGLTTGVYQFQIRSREADEFPGSTVRYADIRYANNGVELIGVPRHSPLLGEAGEDERTGGSASNNSFQPNAGIPGNQPQYLGNLLESDRAAISVAGNVSTPTDIDFFRFDVQYTGISSSGNGHFSTVLDVDYADALVRFNSSMWVFDSQGRLILAARDSNISEDRSGPLAGADLSDLSRGSVGPKDPYIGPVEFPTGSYYVAITSNSQVPDEVLNNPLLRFEPVNSVTRIAEDHVERQGGSTAADPVVPQFINPNNMGPNSGLWGVTQNRGNNPGHGLSSDAFDFSRASPSSGFGTGFTTEFEPNNTLATAQNIDNGAWTLTADPNIGDCLFNPNTGALSNNTSTTIPHITIRGTGDGSYDFYRFTVPNFPAGVTSLRGIFDIDFTNPGNDTEIHIFDSLGNALPIPFQNDDGLDICGQGGSASDDRDSFTEVSFTQPGVYYVGVSRSASNAVNGGLTGRQMEPGDFYTLNISIENFPIGQQISQNRSYYFGDQNTNTVPQNSQGTMVSQPFSLAGYSAFDLPTLYFNYFYDLNSNDRFTVSAIDGNGNTTVLAVSNPADVTDSGITQLQATSGTTWRQARLDLSRLAGQSNLRLRFSVTDASAALNEGVYIDDIVIGFAERGEMITGASNNSAGFQTIGNPGNEVLSGNYQLEMRKATEFGHTVSNAAVGLVLDSSFDTNDRLAEKTTLIAPSGAEVVNGQTFTVSDGVNSITFEYEDPAVADGVTAGNVEIRYKSLSGGVFVNDPAHVIARRIRDAINSPQVQQILKVRAAMSDGEVTGTASRDNRINLFGTALVEQAPEFAILNTTTDPNALRDAIVGTGITPVGNANFVGSDVSAGFFQGGGNVIGLGSGIVLTTGDARSADGPNSNDIASGRASQTGDSEVDGLLAVTTTDTTSLEFDFQFGDGTIGGDLFLNFVFASDEYNENVGNPFADVVAIIIDENADGQNLQNLAVVPTNPSQAISTNTINSGNPYDPSGATGQNSTLFRNNDPTDGGELLRELGYDGLTTKLVAQALNLGPGRHRIKIVVSDVGDLAGDSAIFIEAGSLATQALVLNPTGIESIRHDGLGDQNIFRDQGQVLIHSNTITDSKNFAIVADAGQRDSIGTNALYRDPYSTNSFAQPYPVRLGSPNPGAVRNLVVTNGTPATGGFAPGASIVNNTISGEGVGGIHVSGDSRVFEVTTLRARAGSAAGDSVCDGSFFTITAYGQTVTFEFEDISGSAVTSTNACPTGSGAAGGNGWTEGRIPIFYRRTGPAPYTAQHPTIPNVNRVAGYTQEEMAIAIKDAIDASPLVSNDSTLVVHAYVAMGRSAGGVFQRSDEIDPATGQLLPGADFAVYIEGVSSINVPPGSPQGIHDWRPVSHAHGPQPFTRVVNNTIFGNDGTYSSFPEVNAEPNDTLAVAIDTRQGRQHNPVSYQSSAEIGDSLDFRQDPSVDVDFYQFQLDIGDRVVVDLEAITIGSSLVPVLRLFNSVGEELFISAGDLATGVDPSINFTATANDTYYVAVSGLGNSTYSPISLGSRTGPASTGPYNISVNVSAPRQHVITVRNAANYADGSMFQIEDVTGRVVTFEFDTGGGVAAGNVAIPIGGFRHPEVAVLIAQAINNAVLENTQNLPNGAFGTANPLQPVTAEAFGGIAQARFGLQHTDTAPVADPERLVVVRNAARIIDINSGLQFTPNNNNNQFDQILEERAILVSEQATPTVLNNVMANVRRGLQQVQFQADSQGPADVGAAVPGGMVEGGSAYQHNVINSNIPFSVNDFNLTLSPTEPLFVNAAAHNFFPAPFSRIVDSGVDTVPERNEFTSIRSAIGLGNSPILSPDRDASGQLRVDDPDVDSPFGGGADVFKDRGALDRSDFVGPAAVLVIPQDNDADGIDLDPAVSTIQLSSGIVTAFTIQIVDGFESADPFPGVGVNDNTLDGRFVTITEDGIPLTVKGPAITLFQDGVFLREGIDYTYRFDRTSNTIRLTPLSGVWPNNKVYLIKVNNRDRFVIDAKDGVTTADGETFRVTNDVGDTVTLEFDSGYTIAVDPTLGVQLPLVGTGTGGIADGQRFRVEDGDRFVIFEFDSNNNVLAGNQRIPFLPGQSLDTLANSVVAALQQASAANLIAPLSPRNLGGGQVHLGASPAHRFDFSNTPLTPTFTQEPFSIIVPPGGASDIQDNETFSITNGNQTVVFEFDNNGSGSTVAGSFVIPFVGADTAESLAGLIANAIASQGVLGLNPVAVPGGIVELNATPNHVVNVANSSLTRTMTVGGVRDGERFSINDGNTIVGFEFDSDGVFLDVNNDNIPDNVLIPFSASDTHIDLGNKIVAAVTNANIGMQPVHVNNGVVNLGGTTSHTLNTVRSPSLTRTGEPGVQASTTLQLPASPALLVPAGGAADFTDGETFSVTDGTVTVVFEFDNNGQFEDADNDGQPDNTLINFFPGLDQSQMSVIISAALAAAPLGLNPSIISNGIILLGGTPDHDIDLFASSLDRSDRIGTLTDGETFTVDNGSTVVTFEFEDVALNNGVSPGNTAILFAQGAAIDVVANAMVAALGGANLGLNPTNRGDGGVELGDSVRHLTDIAGAPSLVRSGAPGGAEAINYRLNFTEGDMAKAIVRALNSAGNGNRIDGVSSQLRGGSTLFVDISNALGQPADFNSGYAAVADIPNFFLPAVKDLPGNTLKANQATNETQFTILLAGVQLDFGDLPDSIFGQGRYPTLFENDGARHVITGNPLTLGNSVDADLDGQPNLAATGDDFDHVVNVSGSKLTVVGVAPFSIQVPLTGAAGIADNETFTITRGLNAPITFEFDKNGSGASAGSDEVIVIANGETPDDVANKIVAAINGRLNELGLRPANLGNGVVFIGGSQTASGPSHALDISQSSLQPANSLPINLQTLAAGLSLTVPSKLQMQVGASGGSGLLDGRSFIIDDTVRAPVRFEFDNNGTVTPGSRRIAFSTLQNQTVVANAIVAAIQQAVNDGALAGLTPQHLGSGLIDLGARAAHKLDASNSGLVQFGPVRDAQTFIVDDGVNAPLTFEFDIDNSTNPSNTRIAIDLRGSADDIANAIVTALKTAVVNGDLIPMNPVNLGEGIIDIDAPAGVTINANNTPGIGDCFGIELCAAGLAGGISDGQSFTIGNDTQQIRFEFDRNELAVVPVGTVRVGFGRNASVDQIAAAVRDAINSTTLSMTATVGTGGIVELRGNDEDGVVFQGIFTPVVPGDPQRANLTTTIVVTSSGEGFLDAWIDWNQDGDWDDPNEQVFNSVPVVAGQNTLSVTVPPMFAEPSTLPLGDTYARFRLSSSGNLGPTGLAPDGEVEDYRIRVISNDRPEIVGIGIPDQSVNENAPDTVINVSTFFTDIDIDNGNGDSLTLSVVANDNPALVHASFTNNQTLVLDYQPDQNGFATITVRATDHGGLFVEQTFVVSVARVNARPEGIPQQITTPEDVPVQITLTGDDKDPLPNEVQSLIFTIVGQPANGTITGFNSATGQFTYVPNPNFSGTDQIRFTVTDDGLAGNPASLTSDPVTIDIVVTEVNDKPTGISQSVTINEDDQNPPALILTGDDDGSPTTSEGQQLTFRIASVPAQITIISGVDENGNVTGPIQYRPNLNVNNNSSVPAGPVLLIFSVTDDGTPSETSIAGGHGTISINITPVNDPPIANAVNVSALEDTPHAINFSVPTDIDDGDPEVSQAMCIEIVTQPANGTVPAGCHSSLSVLYTPNPGYTGGDSFTYRVRELDNSAGTPSPLTSAIGVVSINVAPTNDAPVITPPATPIAATEDTVLQFNIAVNDGDPEFNQNLTATITQAPTKGTIEVINATLGQFRYTPNANVNGVDTFVLQVTDDGNPNMTSAPATITINIAAVNDAPTAVNLSPAPSNEDVPVSITLSGDDGDPLAGENQVLNCFKASDPLHGTVTIDPNTCIATYTPNANYNGTDSFTYFVRDDDTFGVNTRLSSAPATVSLTINPLNDPPEFTPGPNVTVNEDAGSQTIIGWASGVRPGPLGATDENGQTITFTISNDNNSLFTFNGQPSLSSSGTLTFTPAPNVNGTAVVTIQAQDNGSGTPPNVNTSATRTFTITVNSVNDAPQFIKGPDVVISEDAGLQTRPNWATNIAPGPVGTTDEVNQTLSFNISTTTTGNLVFVSGPSIDPATGTLQFETAPNTNGTATVVVTLTDSGSGAAPNVNTSAAQTFNITVNAINDAPEFDLAQPDVTASEDAGLVRVAGWASNIRPGPAGATDENGQSLTFLTTVTNLQGGLSFVTPPTVNATTGELSFQTSPDKHGSAVVVVRLQDNGTGFPPHVNASAPRTITITVDPVNDAPEFNVGPNQRSNEDAGQQNVVGWATNIRPGPITASDEATQGVSFEVTTNNPNLFFEQPVVAPNGTLTYTAAPNAFGTAVVTVVAKDDGVPVAQATRQFTITIDPVNDAPTLTVPPLQTVNEDSPLSFGPNRLITVADIDANQIEVKLQAPNGQLTVRTNVPGGVAAGDVLGNGTSTVTLLGTPAAINATLASTDGLIYQGQQNFNGFDVLTITANDLGNTGAPGPMSDTRTVRISVLGTNDPPELANPIADLTLDEDSPNTLIELFPRVFNDPDVATNNDQLSIRVVSNSGPGVVTATTLGTVLSLALVPNANGQAVITLEATDQAGLSVQDTFTLTVLPVNDPPTAVNDAVTVSSNVASTLNVLVNDTDPDGTLNASSVQITSAPNNATVTVNGDGSLRFVPAAGFTGVSRFRYQVQDNVGAVSNEAEVVVTVNAAPVATDDTSSTTQGVPVGIDVTANDNDQDGTLNKGTVTITRAPTNGTASVNPTTGVVTYTPSSTFSGFDTFRYTVRDNNGLASNEATVTITVTPTRFWQNSTLRFDVSNDGHVSPIDVLQIVNRLNAVGPGPLPAPNSTFSPPPFYDVNGDGQLTSIDALQVINHINSGSGGESALAGEGESTWIASAESAEVDSGSQSFGILLAPSFAEFRYSPLASDQSDLLSSFGSDGAGSRSATSRDGSAIDFNVADLIGGDDDLHSARLAASDFARDVEDALSSPTAEVDLLMDYGAAVDEALDDILDTEM